MFLPLRHAQVQGDGGRRDEGPPELLGQLGVERRACPGARCRPELDLVDQVGPAGQVEGHLDQGLVERQGDRREPAHARLVAQRLPQAPRPGRCRRPRRCGGRRRPGRPGPSGRGRTRRAGRAGTACGRRTAAPVATSVSPVPSRSRRIVDRRLLGDPRPGGDRVIGRRHRSRTSSRAARKASSSSGVPTVTRRQPARRGHDEQSRTSTDRSTRPFQTSRPSASSGRKRTKLAPDGHRSHRQPRQGRHQPLALGHHRRHPGLHLGLEPQGQPAGDLAGGVEVVRQHHPLQLLHDLGRPDQVAEPAGGHRPRLGERPGDDQRPVVVDQVQRRPRGELAVGLVDHDQAGRQLDAPPRPRSWGSTSPVGLLGEHRNVIAGSAARCTRAHLVEVEGEVGGALPHRHVGAGDAGDVGVQGVGRLEHGHRAVRGRRRPGTAACRTSLEPLAARPARGRRRGARRCAARRARAWRSG